jgi:hypothetical protein
MPISLFTLRIVRFLLCTKRRWQNTHTQGWEWGSSLVAIARWAGTPFKYIAPVQLIPTIVFLTFSPEHFFARLPQIRTGKKPWLRPPLNFILEGTTALTFLLTVGLPLVGLREFRESLIRDFMIVAILVSPLVLYVILFLAWLFLFCYGKLFSRLAADFLDPIKADLRLCLSPITYRRISWKRFGIAVIAADIHLFISISIVLVLGFEWIRMVTSFLGAFSQENSGEIQIVFLPVALAAYYLCARMYMRILEASTIIPPFRLAERRVEHLNAIMNSINDRPTPEVAAMLTKCWARERHVMRRYELPLAKFKETYLKERALAYWEFDQNRLRFMIQRLTMMSMDHRDLDRMYSEIERIRELA